MVYAGLVMYDAQVCTCSVVVFACVIYSEQFLFLYISVVACFALQSFSSVILDIHLISFNYAVSNEEFVLYHVKCESAFFVVEI